MGFSSWAEETADAGACAVRLLEWLAEDYQRLGIVREYLRAHGDKLEGLNAFGSLQEAIQQVKTMSEGKQN